MSELDFSLERDVHSVLTNLAADPDPTERSERYGPGQAEFSQLRHRLLPDP